MFRTLSFLVRMVLWFAFFPLVLVYAGFVAYDRDFQSGANIFFKSMGWITNPFHR